jgi:hypothetical protein
MTYDFRRHSAYSDPGRHVALLDEVPTDLAALSAVARNVIVHYRAAAERLPEATRADIHSRWLATILDADQQRHGSALAEPRDETERVQGCCRDHSLFCVGVLRQHGVAARTRVGFAGYFEAGFHHDHVVVETRRADRWVRFDPEVAEPLDDLATPLDMAVGPDSYFLTAAETWQQSRAGNLDPDRFGVGPDQPFRGPWFIQNYVLMELAHRFGDELLLWDGWGAMSEPGGPTADETALTDEVAALLVAADREDPGAGTELAKRYANDARLHPGSDVIRHSPYGDPPIRERIGRRA